MRAKDIDVSTIYAWSDSKHRSAMPVVVATVEMIRVTTMRHDPPLLWRADSKVASSSGLHTTVGLLTIAVQESCELDAWIRNGMADDVAPSVVRAAQACATVWAKRIRLLPEFTRGVPGWPLPQGEKLVGANQPWGDNVFEANPRHLLSPYASWLASYDECQREEKERAQAIHSKRFR